jgi:hypothetical protein
MLYESRKFVPRIIPASDTQLVVPSFPNVTKSPTLLMHFDGSQGSQVFVDATGQHRNGAAIDSNGGSGADCFLDQAQAKFGVSSLRVGPDVGPPFSWMVLDGSADMASRQNDFTVDFWAMRNSQHASIMYSTGEITARDIGSLNIFWFSDNIIYVDVGAVDPAITGPTVNDTLVWHHFAVTRAGTTLRLFVDGTKAVADYTSTQVMDISPGTPTVGNEDHGGTHFDGWIDELRILNNTAAWTANFTPPTSPYVVSS